MTEFTPIASSAGGLMIGAAAAMLLLGLGRIAGISGILGAVVTGGGSPEAWRLAFLAGLPLGAWVMTLGRGDGPIHVEASPATLVVAGILVGFGTRLGSGCTSGHGVCGMARGSGRSFAATALFMTAGFATVALVRHVVGVGG